MARPFDVTKIEKKWQDRWLEDGTYEVDNDDLRERYYALCMYPYPSGSAHQGHVRIYTFGDVNVRYQTMLGKAVLSPFGFDSFGLPAENAAIKAGTHPRIFTEARIVELKSSLSDSARSTTGAERSAATTRRTFAGPGDIHRVLEGRTRVPREARRQLVPRMRHGAGQRTGPGRRDLRTLRRPRRASEPRAVVLQDHRLRRRALERPRHLEWPDRVKTMQRNWIGRSPRASSSTWPSPATRQGRIRVFTTRPDTAFGITYAVVAPEHPLLDELTTDDQRAGVTELRRAAHQGERNRSHRDLRRRRRTREARRLHRQLRASIHSTANRCRSTSRTTCSAPTAPARSWRCRARTNATTPSPWPTGCRWCAPSQLPEGFEGGAYTGDGPKINSGFLDGLDVADGEGSAPPSSSSEQANGEPRSTTAFATG